MAPYDRARITASSDHANGLAAADTEGQRLLQQAIAGIEAATTIIRGLNGGLTDMAIARDLGISSRTLNRRISRLMEATGACTRFQLAAALAASGVLQQDPVAARPSPGRVRMTQAERLRRQLERRGGPVRAIVWLWLEEDYTLAAPAGCGEEELHEPLGS